MKSMMLKLIKISFLAAVLLIFSPQMPRVDQVFTPPEIHQPKPPLPPPPGVKHLQKVEDLVLELTNQARRAKGLAPLSKDEELRGVARAYSDDMLVRRFFDHTTPDGVSFDERISNHYPHRFYVVGENIWSAFGYNPGKTQQVAQEIVNDWMNSPGHRANLLSPDYTHLGVGVSARQQTILATQEFVGKSKAFTFGELIKLIRARVSCSRFLVPS
jgi:uncharacterized protein YkwD